MKVEGDDPGDACRYGLHDVNETASGPTKEMTVAQAVTALGPGASAHSRYMAAEHAERQFDKGAGNKMFMLPRNVGRHRRVMSVQ